MAVLRARHAEAAVSRVSPSDDPARLGRGGYVYLVGMMLFVVMTGGLDRFERIASADVFAVLGLAAQALSRSRWPSAPPRS